MNLIRTMHQNKWPFTYAGMAAVLVCLLALPACTSVDEMVETVDKINADTKANTILTEERLREIFSYNPRKPKRPVPHVYCYQVMQDVICYKQQIPGAEDRLVSWQGTSDAPTPIPSVVQSAPTPRYVLTPPGLKPHPSASATGKPLKPLEPVFVGKMPEVKTESKLQVNEVTGSPIF